LFPCFAQLHMWAVCCNSLSPFTTCVMVMSFFNKSKAVQKKKKSKGQNE
jgi:hypothetical protein